MNTRSIPLILFLAAGCGHKEDDAIRYGPIEKYEVVYLANWENSAFWPCSTDECPNIDAGQCWGTIRKNAGFPSDVMALLAEGQPVHFSFWGRRTTGEPKKYGHLGAYGCQMIAEKVIFARALDSMSVRSKRFASGG